MDEDGLYDYVIVNDELDKAFEELTLIAERAQAGEIGAAPEHMQVLPPASSLGSCLPHGRLDATHDQDMQPAAPLTPLQLVLDDVTPTIHSSSENDV